MRPEHSSSSAPLTGPQGMVPESYFRACRLHREGRYQEALLCLDGLFEQGTTARLNLREATLLKAWTLIELKRHGLCRQWLTSACNQGYLEATDPAVMVLELNLQLFNEQYEIVQNLAEQYLADQPSAVDTNQAELRLLLGAALRWQGDLTEAVPHLEFACSAFLVLNRPDREAVATNFLGWTHLSRGHLVEGRRWFEKSLQINTGLGAHLRMAQNYQNLSIVAYKQGRYSEALQFLTRELDLVEDSPDMTCRARIARGNVQRLRGDFSSARRALMQAYSLAVENSLSREEALSLEFLGDVLRDEGNPAEARRYYQRALVVARALSPRGDLVMELLRRDGECLDLEGRHEEAHHVLNDALALCREVGDRFESAVTRRCLGVNAANLGRWKKAGENLQSAIDGLQELAARHETMIAQYHLAIILARQIDTGNAGSGSSRLLEKAWQGALTAQQLNRELEVPFLALEIKNLLSGLAGRRLILSKAPTRPAAFSARLTSSTRIIAVSGVMRQVLRTCDGFAHYDTPVLITGKTGSGKELLAHRIHETSPRGRRPLIKVNCIPTADDVLARELFGQARPGDQGGLADVPGLIAQAEGGTLLLSGVEHLPRSIQIRMADLLKNGCYRPLGDSRERKANVRVIATSSHDLREAVDRGSFRPDLHFKLSLMTVSVPDLRDRHEDILPLLDHFLSRLEGSTLTARSLFDFQALEALAIHHWPGQVAELESVAQRAWLNRDLGQALRLRRVKSKVGPALEFIFPETTAAPKGSPTAQPPDESMTWSSLNSLIDRAGGNKSHVARNLGISRVTLYRWLNRLNPEN